MKTAPVLLAGLVGLPLAAQTFEAGLFLGRQQYPSPQVDLGRAWTSTWKPGAKTVYAARLGYTVAGRGPLSLQVTAGYQPSSESTVESTLGTPGLTLKTSHWSLGAMFQARALVAVGAGLEFRSERLSGNVYGASSSTTYNRPWVRLNAGHAIPGPVVQPFFGVEVAFPLTTATSRPNLVTTSSSEALKSLAPKNQFGLYAGIRF